MHHVDLDNAKFYQGPYPPKSPRAKSVRFAQVATNPPTCAAVPAQVSSMVSDCIPAIDEFNPRAVTTTGTFKDLNTPLRDSASHLYALPPIAKQFHLLLHPSPCWTDNDDDSEFLSVKQLLSKILLER